MDNSKSYQLSYDSYMEHLIDVMQDMFNGSDFTDLTLVCDDMEMVKTHKAILSACSPVFKKMLQYSKDSPETMIFLKGYKKEDLQSLLQFIFTGEIIINEERTDRILQIAEEFELKDINIETQQSSQANIDNTVNDEDLSNDKDDHEERNKSLPKSNTRKKKSKNKTKSDGRVKEEGIKSDLNVSNESDIMVYKKYKCPVETCHKSYSDEANCRRHYRKKHKIIDETKEFEKKILEKIYQCADSECDLSYTTKRNMLRHYSKRHDSNIGSNKKEREESIVEENVEFAEDIGIDLQNDKGEVLEGNIKEDDSDTDGILFKCIDPNCNSIYRKNEAMLKHFNKAHCNVSNIP